MVQWILEQKTQSKDICHHLDDFIMVHGLKTTCKYYDHYAGTMQTHRSPPV